MLSLRARWRRGRRRRGHDVLVETPECGDRLEEGLDIGGLCGGNWVLEGELGYIVPLGKGEVMGLLEGPLGAMLLHLVLTLWVVDHR